MTSGNTGMFLARCCGLWWVTVKRAPGTVTSLGKEVIDTVCMLNVCVIASVAIYIPRLMKLMAISNYV